MSKKLTYNEMKSMNERLIRENYSYEASEKAYLVIMAVMAAVIIALSVTLTFILKS